MIHRVKRLTLLFLLLPLAASAGTEPIDWADAETCVGEVCSVRGTVVDVKDDGTAIRLYFDEKRRDVCVTLVRSWLVSWPDYAGREIVANGLVRRFRDQTEVTVLDPGEITLAATAVQPTPAIEFESPAKEEAQDLREEIRRLEQRVKELESR